MTLPEPFAEWVWLARIRRPQGRKGEVLAEILTDFPEKFAERRRLWLIRAPGGAVEERTWRRGFPKARDPEQPPREVELTSHWLHKGGVVLHFAGVDSITAAEMLKDIVVAVPRTERAALSEDEIYVSDLVGCTLLDVARVDAAGVEAVPIGVIENVDRTAGPTPLLVVRSAKREVLVPFAKSYLRRIDLEAKRVEMALPEGLADLN